MLAALCITACNDKSGDSETDTITSAGAAVKDFSLKADTNVLANLDSVFFSIDLDGRRIFNADSLPKGTDVSRLVVNISTPTVRACTLSWPDGEGGTSEVDYLASQTDSIDFSRGPVTLTVTSLDGVTTVNYTVSVNVHKMNPDSLQWDALRRQSLPTTLAEPVAQRTVEHRGRALCLTADAGGAACLAVSDNPGSEPWTMADAALPAGADIRSLTSAAGILYLRDSAGTLYASADDGASWTATDARMDAILGAYDGTVVGTLRQPDGAWTIVRHPSGETLAAPDGFPVQGGASALISYTTEWSDSPVAVMVGGLDADGVPVAATWAFDGSRWAAISLPGQEVDAATGIALVPYFAYKVSDTWRLSRHTCLLALGGAGLRGVATRSVFVSYDRGITWVPAISSLRLPAYMPAFTEADALVFDTEMSAPTQSPRRVASAVTSWDCPEIYLFGGMTGLSALDPGAEPVLHNTVWRGVINRLTFRPLY